MLTKLLLMPLSLFANLLSGHREDIRPGRYGLDLVFEPPEPVVDVVAVHGLNGDRERAWLGPNSTSWIRDLLPQVEKRSRIMTYGYNADTISSSADVSAQFMFNLAETLLSDITTFRQKDNTQKRPLIFIAHSLGGLVVKSALIRSHLAQDEDGRSLALSTHGIFFFGTPHRGANGVVASRFLLNAKGLFQSTNDRILRHLAMDSEWLQEQSALYSHIANDFVTKFMYETQRTKVLPGLKIMLVPYSSAVPGSTPNSEAVALEADHVSMVKFSTADDVNFRRIAERLAVMIDGCEVKVRDNWVYPAIPALPSNPGTNSIKAPGASLPVQFPYPRNERFIGRQDELAKLQNVLLPDNSTQRLNIAVLYGTGGMGKTQIALEFAYRHHKQYSAVLWVNARDEVSAKRDFVEIAHRLYPGWKDNTAAARATASPPKTLFPEAQQLVRIWLSEEKDKSWLMIFDNFDDVDSYNLRKDFFPRVTHGSILVTSRRPASKRLGNFAVEVNELDPESAHAILRGDSWGQEGGDEGLDMLAEKLRYMPLALDQANAYIEAQQITYSDYLELYESDFARVTAKWPPSSFWSYESTVFTTWEVSLTAVSQQDEAGGTCAAYLFLILGFLEPNDIDPELFRYTPLKFILRRGTRCPISESLGLLISYSLIRRHDNRKSIFVHPVVQTWARERLSSESRADALRIVADLVEIGGQQMDWMPAVRSWWSADIQSVIGVEESSNEDEEVNIEETTRAVEALSELLRYSDQELYRAQRAVLPHIDAVIQAISRYSMPGNAADEALDRLVDLKLLVYTIHGRWDDALNFSHDRLQMLGPRSDANKAEWLHRYDSYAYITMLSGDLDLAGELLNNMAKFLINDEAYGPQSIEYCRATHLLAQLHILQGDVESAAFMSNISRAVAQQEYSHFNPVELHSYPIQGEVDAAWIDFQQGRVQQAEEEYLGLVQTLANDLGPLNPRTLSSLNDLAQIYRHQGRYQDAESVLLQVIQEHVKVFGESHPNSLVYKTNLARVYSQYGMLGDAEQILAEVCLAWQERLSNHPAALVSAADLYELTSGMREEGYFGVDPEDIGSTRDRLAEYDGRRRGWLSGGQESANLACPSFSWRSFGLSLFYAYQFFVLVVKGILDLLVLVSSALWSSIREGRDTTSDVVPSGPDMCFWVADWKPFSMPEDARHDEVGLTATFAFGGIFTAFYLTGTGPFY